MLTCYAALQATSAAVVPHQLLQLLYVQVADSMQQQVQMGMADANPQMLLGSGALTDAVTAAMHAVPSGMCTGVMLQCELVLACLPKTCLLKLTLYSIRMLCNIKVLCSHILQVRLCRYIANCLSIGSA